MRELLIENGRVLTMGPQGTLENGQVLIRDGKIAGNTMSRYMPGKKRKRSSKRRIRRPY